MFSCLHLFTLTYPVIKTFISVGLSSSVRKKIADEKSSGKDVDKEDNSWATRKIMDELGIPALVNALDQWWELAPDMENSHVSEKKVCH